MKLWTNQPPEVLDILERDGVYYCEPNKSENYEELKEAYDWIANEMRKRNIPNPSNAELPLWAWHTRDWKHKKPDLRLAEYGESGRRYVCIEFEIADDCVLLSDQEFWHCVLNDAWIDDSTNDTEFDEMWDKYEKLSKSEKEDLKIKSWQKIFNVEPLDTEWETRGRYIQATFWELRKEMVTGVRYFTAR